MLTINMTFKQLMDCVLNCQHTVYGCTQELEAFYILNAHGDSDLYYQGVEIQCFIDGEGPFASPITDLPF